MKQSCVSRSIIAAAIAVVAIPVALAGTYYDNNNVEWSFSVDADGGAIIESVTPPYSGYDPMYGGGYYYNWDGSIPSYVRDGYEWDPDGTRYPVTAIGDSALSGLANSAGSGDPTMTSSIYVPDTVKRIGDYALSGFSNVTDIFLPEGLEYLGQDPFDGCGISYDWEYESQGLLAYDGWILGPWRSWDYTSTPESADMSAAKGIAAGAFSGCTSLRSVILPVNAGILPRSVFSSCTALTDVVIPASVTNIEAWAFSSCSSLTNITFVGNAPTLKADPYNPNDPESAPFYGVSPQCVITVQQGTTGWGTVPGTWNGIPTRYATAPSTYTITWRDDDGSLIDENSSWVYGAVPSHADPDKVSDDQYDYYFLYWTPELEPVVSNTTYTAVYSHSLRYYNITWLNDNGARIRVNSVGYGTTPTPPVATKAPSAFYTYTLSGWTPEIVPVTGSTTYRAVYAAHPIYAGSGTEADPYIATNKAALVALVSATNNLYVQLAAGLSIDGPITVPASMTMMSIDMNGGTIAGTNGDPAIILSGNTQFSAKGTGTITADVGVEAVHRPGSVSAESGVTVTGLGGAAGPAAFAADGEAITAGIAQGANGKWTLTAFAELEDGTAEGLADSQVKVVRADSPQGLGSATPMENGVTVKEKKNAVKVELEVETPAGAPAQFFKVRFGE